jgi:hypothetical protein
MILLYNNLNAVCEHAIEHLALHQVVRVVDVGYFPVDVLQLFVSEPRVQFLDCADESLLQYNVSVGFTFTVFRGKFGAVNI